MKCKYCGDEFERTQDAQKYCVKCREISSDRRTGRVFNNDMVQTCAHCGAKYTRDRKTKYCSDECSKAAQLDRLKSFRKTDEYVVPKTVKRERKCTVCGMLYMSSGKGTMCVECHKEHTRRILIERRMTEDIKVCAWCGELFTSTIASHQRFCGLRCSNAYNGKVKRARKRKAYVRPVYLKDIYTRDKGLCGLCGERVDLEHVYPHPMSASIDHILPLSKGGTHEPRNVQLTHLRCNVEKGVRAVGEQLRLC